MHDTGDVEGDTPPSDGDSRVDGNSRLTALLGAIVLPLFVAAWLVGKVGGLPLLTTHIVLGLILTAPLAAKLASVSYRMVSYYRGVTAYRRRGRPANHLRLLGGVLGACTLAVLASGLVLLFGPAPTYSAAKSVHSVSAWIALLALALHLVGHLPETVRLIAGEARANARTRTAARRRLAVVTAALLCGGLLAAGLFQQASRARHHFHPTHTPAVHSARRSTRGALSSADRAPSMTEVLPVDAGRHRGRGAMSRM